MSSRPHPELSHTFGWTATPPAVFSALHVHLSSCLGVIWGSCSAKTSRCRGTARLPSLQPTPATLHTSSYVMPPASPSMLSSRKRERGRSDKVGVRGKWGGWGGPYNTDLNLLCIGPSSFEIQTFSRLHPPWIRGTEGLPQAHPQDRARNRDH